MTPHKINPRPHYALREDDPPPCEIPARGQRGGVCSSWSVCQAGAACVSYREWTVSGRTDLRLGRSPNRRIFRILFADKDRGAGGVRVENEAAQA
jgi:hypothetical protein